MRHLPADHHGFLTEEGRARAKVLQAYYKARHRFDPHETLAIHSQELRTLKTCQAVFPEIEEAEHREVYSNDRHCDTESAVAVIKRYANTVTDLIVVTHLEMTGTLPQAFASAMLDGAEGFPRGELERGDCYLIDCEKKVWELLSA